MSAGPDGQAASAEQAADGDGAVPKRAVRAGVDRTVVAILLIGAATLALVLWIFNSTLAAERDHTRAVLVAQHVGRDLATASIAVHEAAAGAPIVRDQDDIHERTAAAEAYLRGALGQPGGDEDGDAAGKIEDDAIRERLNGLATAIAAFRRDLGPALEPSASTPQRALVADQIDALRQRNAAIVEIRRGADRPRPPIAPTCCASA